MADGDGTGNDSGNQSTTGGEWRAQLPADLKDNEAFTGFKTVGDFAKAHLETSGKIKTLEGSIKDNYVPKLKDGASKEEMEAYHKAIGRPDKPEDYAFDKIDYPEGVQTDPQLEGLFRKWAHEAGLNKTQAAFFHKTYANAYISAAQAAEVKRQQAMQDGLAGLQREWGGKFAENSEMVKREVERIDKIIPGFKKSADETGLGNHPFLVKMVLHYAKANSDGNLVDGKSPGGGGGKPGLFKYKDMG